MRIVSVVATALMVCGAVHGAGRSETATYVDGNLTGISPNTTGTLQFSGDKTINLKTTAGTVEVPYTGVTKTELGATKVYSHNAGGSGRKTETQLLTIGFRNADGEEKTMTLELAKPSAKSIASTIQTRTAKLAKPARKTAVASAKPPKSPKPAKASKQEAKAKPEAKQKPTESAKASVPAKPAANEWWGDDYWKTTRNAGKWNKPAGAAAAEQQ